MLLPWAIGATGAIMKGRKYLWAPIPTVIFHMVSCLGALRVSVCRSVNLTHFYSVLSSVVCVVVAAVTVLWGVAELRDNLWGESFRKEMVSDSPTIYEHIYKPATELLLRTLRA